MIEQTILANLVHNETFTRRVVPFIRSEYFTDISERTVFDLITSYIGKYNGMPTRETLAIELDSLAILSQGDHETTVDLIKTLRPSICDEQWLLDQTERFCQDKALRLAILKSIEIMDGSHESLSKGAIPQVLSDALGVSFDSSVGHDYFDDAEARYEFYNKREDRIKFHLSLFNKITNGGLPRKTLNVILAGTGVGKTLFMCDAAAGNLMDGKNVLYITMEMAEERIAERIDAKLLDVTVKELQRMPRDMYAKKIKRVREKTVGKLVIKEYPTASANANHFRQLIQELKLKKNFVPDIIYIDYLNICSSFRIKIGANANSYTYVKSIAEELRGLAVECNVPIITATQTNRSGYSDNDPGLEATSESFGLPMTADFMFALASNEELEKLGQILVKQLKNRYGDPSYWRRFVIGVDRDKMTLYDVEDGAQPEVPTGNPNHDEDGVIDDRPVMDTGRFNEDSADKRSAFRLKFNKGS